MEAGEEHSRTHAAVSEYCMGILYGNTVWEYGMGILYVPRNNQGNRPEFWRYTNIMTCFPLPTQFIRQACFSPFDFLNERLCAMDVRAAHMQTLWKRDYNLFVSQ